MTDLTRTAAAPAPHPGAEEDALAYFTQIPHPGAAAPGPANRNAPPTEALDQMFGYWSG